MGKRARQTLAGLTAALIVAATACSAGATAVTPVAHETTGLPQSPTSTPDAESDRNAVISYVSDLTLLSDEFTDSLEDARIYANINQAGNERILSIQGPEGSLELILDGYRNRLDKLQTAAGPPQIARIHSLAVQIVKSEVEWLADYRRTSSSGMQAARQALLEDYDNTLQISTIELIHDLIRDLLAAHNVPFERVNFRSDEFRLTIAADPNGNRILSRRGLEVDETERQTVQAAIDLLIADNALTNLTTAASAAATADFSAVDFDNTAGGTAFLFPAYLRQNPTNCSYTWDVEGRVVSQDCQ